MTARQDPFQAVAAMVSRFGWDLKPEDLAEITWALQEIHHRLAEVRVVCPSVDVSANLWALMERVGLPVKRLQRITNPTLSPAQVGRMGEASAPGASDTRANAAVVDGLNVAPGEFSSPGAGALRNGGAGEEAIDEGRKSGGGGVMTSEAKAPAAPMEAAPDRLSGKDQEFKLLPIGKLVPSKTNPRKNFDDASLEKLTESIRNTGIQLPLIVRPQNGHFEIVAGERRFRAAKKAGIEQLPALIRELTDEQAMEVQLIENLQRKEVHPLEEAEGFRRLLDSGKYTVESLAKKIGEGKSVGYVYARLKLSKLIEPAKKAFLNKEIEAEHAVLIARLDPKAQEQALDICGIVDDPWDSATGKRTRLEYKIASRDLAAWIHRVIYMELEKAPWDPKDAALVPKAGACNTCPKKAGNSPDLFGDAAPKKETCTDRICFQSKVDAFVMRRVEEIESKGHKVKLVSREYHDVPKGILRRGDWHQLETGAKPCDKTMKGYVATGDGFDQVLNICVGQDCRAPGHGHMSMPSRSSRGSRSSGSGDGPSPNQLDEQRRERERIDRNFKEYSRMELFQKVLEKTTKIERGDLELLAVISQGLPYLHGRKKPDWMPPDLSGVKEAAKAKDAVLAKFLVASALGDELGEHGDAKLLIAAARRHKLPVDEILERNKERAKNEEAHRQQVKKWEGRVAAQASSYDEPTCKSCGCVEANACPGGCEWLKLNPKSNVGLCSACEEASKRR